MFSIQNSTSTPKRKHISMQKKLQYLSYILYTYTLIHKMTMYVDF